MTSSENTLAITQMIDKANRMNTVEVRTEELSNSALDWAVAKARWLKIDGVLHEIPINVFMAAYTSDVVKGEQIIDLEHILMTALPGRQHTKTHGFEALVVEICDDQAIIHTGYGPTRLIAAMRAFVQRWLGSSVNIPLDL
jgi:hypothetical protein